MKNKRAKAIQFLQKCFKELSYDRTKLMDYCNIASKQFNIELSIIANNINDIYSLENNSDLLLYQLLSAWQEYTGRSIVKKYYKEKPRDIKINDKSITFNVIQVNDNVWVGKISLSYLLELSKLNLVKSIMSSQDTANMDIYDYENLKYTKKHNKNKVIGCVNPTVILNMPKDYSDDLVFNYNIDRLNLTVNNIFYFDILDFNKGIYKLLNAYKFGCIDDLELELKVCHYSELEMIDLILQYHDGFVGISRFSRISEQSKSLAGKIVNDLNSNQDCKLYHIVHTYTDKDSIDYSLFVDILDSIFKQTTTDYQEIENYLIQQFNYYFAIKSIIDINSVELTIMLFVFKENFEHSINNIVLIIDLMIQAYYKEYSQQIDKNIDYCDINRIEEIYKEVELCITKK